MVFLPNIPRAKLEGTMSKETFEKNFQGSMLKNMGISFARDNYQDKKVSSNASAPRSSIQQKKGAVVSSPMQNPVSQRKSSPLASQKPNTADLFKMSNSSSPIKELVANSTIKSKSPVNTKR